jgi:hypothetical protein
VTPIRFAFIRTKARGTEAVQPRYRVACITCGAVVHDSTTSPMHARDLHVRSAHVETAEEYFDSELEFRIKHMELKP